jgi:Flp pilus assembly protein TadD
MGGIWVHGGSARFLEPLAAKQSRRCNGADAKETILNDTEVAVTPCPWGQRTAQLNWNFSVIACVAFSDASRRRVFQPKLVHEATHQVQPYTSPRILAIAVLLAVGAAIAQAQQPPERPLASLLAEEKWSEALTLIDAQLKAKPNDIELLMNRGAVLSAMGRNAEALAVFQKIAAANPQMAAAHNNMAVILAASGKYDDARVALDKAIRVAPGYATAHENLGDLYAHLAADAYRKALQFDKNLETAKPKLEVARELTALASGEVPTPGVGAQASADKTAAVAPAAGTTAHGVQSAPAIQAAPIPPAPTAPTRAAGTSVASNTATRPRPRLHRLRRDRPRLHRCPPPRRRQPTCRPTTCRTRCARGRSRGQTRI